MCKRWILAAMVSLPLALLVRRVLTNLKSAYLRGGDFARAWDVAFADTLEDVRAVLSFHGRLAGEQGVERRAEAVDIADGAKPVEAAGGLFRAHE